MTTNDERQMLRQTVAALVDKHAGPEAVRRAMNSERGYDELLWSRLCEQVGAAALVVPFVSLCTPGQPSPYDDFPFVALGVVVAAFVIGWVVIRRRA